MHLRPQRPTVILKQPASLVALQGRELQRRSSLSQRGQRTSVLVGTAPRRPSFLWLSRMVTSEMGYGRKSTSRCASKVYLPAPARAVRSQSRIECCVGRISHGPDRTLRHEHTRLQCLASRSRPRLWGLGCAADRRASARNAAILCAWNSNIMLISFVLPTPD